MKFLKPGFFYYFLVIACLFAAGAFFLLPSEKKLSLLKTNILDSTQYLFPESGDSRDLVDLNIIENTFLAPAAPPFLVKGNVFGALGNSQREEISQYVVQNGDTLSSIAKKFRITLETLLWANNLSSRSIIRPGQKLIVLPISGVLHVVRGGETLSEISQTYRAKLNAIVEFNGIGDEGKIYAGDLLIIPGGKKPKILQKYHQVPISNSYFICPIPSPCRITQGLHWFNAIDFSNGKCGEPVFAAAGGKVQRIGYTRLGGYYVRILHQNGVITYYGHLSKIAARIGQKVYQGEIVGYIGHTGHTIPAGPAGCHLHFDVRFAKNPFARYPVGTELGK